MVLDSLKFTNLNDTYSVYTSPEWATCFTEWRSEEIIISTRLWHLKMSQQHSHVVQQHTDRIFIIHYMVFRCGPNQIGTSKSIFLITQSVWNFSACGRRSAWINFIECMQVEPGQHIETSNFRGFNLNRCHWNAPSALLWWCHVNTPGVPDGG